MIDPHLLQLIRLEIATFGAQVEDLPCLGRPDQEAILRHLMRLYLGGEIAGTSHVEAGVMHIGIRGLTHFGRLEMHSFRTRFPDTSDDWGGEG